MDININELLSKLNEEERLSLINILQKVSDTDIDIDKIDESEQTAEFNENQYSSIFYQNSKLISPVELIFNITCTVINKNQKGEVDFVEQILTKNYHIALNNKHQVKLCVDSFFNSMQTKISEAAETTLKDE